MRSVLMVCLTLLVGCAAPLTPVPEGPTLRDPTANFASQVDVTAQDLNGAWVVRQDAGRSALIISGEVNLGASVNALLVPPPAPNCDALGLCSAGAGVQSPLRYSPTLQGRWQSPDTEISALLGLPREIWVLWMDFDRRTVALGDPDGTFVAILDRSETGGEDRIVAAREILDWFGYDLDQLQTR